jgi:hypothetical protein
MPWPRQIARPCRWIYDCSHRCRAIPGRDPCRGADLRIDGDGECRSLGLGIAFDHQPQFELVRAFFSDRSTDQSGGVLDEKRDLLRGDFICGKDQIALILPVLIIYDENDFTARNRRDGIDDRIGPHD